MTKWLMGLAIALPALIGADDLCPDCPGMQWVKDKLGPIYHQIYSHVLTDTQRDFVTNAIKRGLNPYEAINVLLRTEERKFSPTPNYNAQRRHSGGFTKFRGEILQSDPQ